MASEFQESISLQNLSRRGEHSNGNTLSIPSITPSTGDEIQQSGTPASSQEGLSLPPVDRGFAAWSFVFAGFMLEALVWGFGFTSYKTSLLCYPIMQTKSLRVNRYGVFQEYFLHHRTFGDASEAEIGAVGTHNNGRTGNLLWKLIPSKLRNPGILFGIGGGGLYAPVIIYLSEWFTVRRGLAAAIVFGGSGAGGTCFPIAVNFLLSRLGFRWTLRIWAGFMLVFGALALAFTRPRLPVVRLQNSDRPNIRARFARQHWGFLKSPVFICMTLTNIVQALAYFPVSLYMSVYTTSLGLSALDGSLVLSVFNFSSIIGQVIFGHACDVAPYQYVIFISGAGASLSAYLLWGFAHSLGFIFAFAIIFGSLSGGFASVWPAALLALSNQYS
ncbi:unnamed protein product [Rhizoctonia solani]|uniref:Major facilitator superfamily (MFS) profile domain-containing protein n=1 Tax=Rhizoctonia solani TaxID=456999 RepID=A0A8H3H6D2_9AGAM|nr:unnamed protein product [Rhizoctonia solani]